MKLCSQGSGEKKSQTKGEFNVKSVKKKMLIARATQCCVGLCALTRVAAVLACSGGGDLSWLITNCLPTGKGTFETDSHKRGTLHFYTLERCSS